MKTITRVETEKLVDLLVTEREELLAEANFLPSLQISERSVCDLEMLTVGAFSPLSTFMNRADYERVVGEMRLADGTIFPIPVTLPINERDVLLGKDVALRDSRNNLLAVLSVEEIYEWSHQDFVNNILGTADSRHPLAAESARWGKFNASGKLRVVNLPPHYDFQEIRLTPKQTREKLAKFENVVAFQTRNPLHRAHEEMTKLAAASVNGVLLLQPVVGMTKTGDIDYLTRVRTYKILAENYYAKDEILLSLLPLAMRFAGPREALWHALIRSNYGANYFIVGRDHASPGVDSNGKPFYQPTAAQELAQKFSAEIGIGIIPFGEMVYLPDENRYAETTKVGLNAKTLTLSGTEVREDYLAQGIRLPEWFSRREVAEILAESYPPRCKQGVCLWFTGLSGSGKSTTAEILTILLMENGRRVTLLDGDVVRTHLSKGLGFSKEDRDVNILRIGFVAAEIVRHGGTAICAAVSPYAATRNEVRNLVGYENFVEIFVDTPLEVCEQRDVKGMYAKARRGEIKGFTGIDDPYETPPNAEITIDTVMQTGAENARIVLEYLKSKGFV